MPANLGNWPMQSEPNGLLAGLLSGPSIPATDEEWEKLDFQVQFAFTPHTAIDDQQLFAGRYDLIVRVIETVFQDGQHAIVYGDRGVGKTSFANIVGEKVFKRTNAVKTIKRSCTVEHDFKLIWQHVFDDYNYEGVAAAEWLETHNNPFDIFKLLASMATTCRPIVIIDEFDRVQDPKTKILMADTIKYLSDYDKKTTVIIVGVADSVMELFSGHKSIPRSLEQIRMPRMNAAELQDIIRVRMSDVGMRMDMSTRDEIVRLSQGFPGFTHLLGQTSARAAIRRRSITVSDFDLAQAIPVAIEKADATIKDAYASAIRSSKPNNQYKQVLLACARAASDERGCFLANAVCDPLSHIVGRRREIPSFARHLNEFCDKDRGPALIKTGVPKRYEYRFADALLRPFITLNGAKDAEQADKAATKL
jgi:Cdc6-like AAA superfamily ATPase